MKPSPSDISLMNMRIAYLGLKPGSVKKPPPFTLKDLPKYSRTLKLKNT